VISIIVPTYNEVKNLPTLLDLIAQVMSTYQLEYEVLIMDDVSQDGSEEVVKQYSQKMPVKIIVRHNKIRGLSDSVIDGLYQAKGKFLLVMDADMSHPVDAIPAMIEQLKLANSDFVIGSRYTSEGSLPKDWGIKRRLNSWVATILARPLAKVSDPMSGFFAICNKNLPARHTLNPIGYKIALEVLIKGGFKEIYEHPIHFQDRIQGESKLTFSEQLKYLRHLRRLYQYRYSTWAELVQFAGVGSIGFVIDLALYYLLQGFGLQHQIARAISFWPAVTSNWLLNRTITFNHRSYKKPLRQWINFVMTSLIGFFINWGSYTLMTTHIDFFNQYKVIALMTGVAMGMGFNFLFSNLFVFHNLRVEEGMQKNSNHRNSEEK
jgi:dolichol-phosphate mannosyltransferase